MSNLFLVREDKGSFIARDAREVGGSIIVVAGDLHCGRSAGDLIDHGEFDASERYPVTEISGFDSYRKSGACLTVDIYEAESMGHQVVCDDVIRHADLSPNEAIRAIIMYVH